MNQHVLARQAQEQTNHSMPVQTDRQTEQTERYDRQTDRQMGTDRQNREYIFPLVYCRKTKVYQCNNVMCDVYGGGSNTSMAQ